MWSRFVRLAAPVIALGVVATACTTSAGSAGNTTTTETAELACGAAFPREEAGLGIGEVSATGGMVASRRHPGVLWLVGTVRGQLRLWAVGPDGESLAELALPTDDRVIDVAIASEAEGDMLYLALSDDEEATRQTHRVMRMAEPEPDSTAFDPRPTVLEFTSAEAVRPVALLVDADDLYLIGSVRRRSVLYRAPLQAGGDDLMPVAAVDGVVTDADLSQGGDVISMLTNTDLMLWNRPPGAGVADTVATAPCIGRLSDIDLGGAIALEGAGELGIVHAGLQPALAVYSLPPSTDRALDEDRAGSLAPRVTITSPSPGFTIIDGVPIEAVAQVEDDAPLQASRLRWTLETTRCPADGACEVTDVSLESGNPISVTPAGADLAGSTYVLTATYTDDFDLTATDTLQLPFQLPEPILGSSVDFINGYVEIGDIPGLLDDMTLEMWLRPDDLSGLRLVWGKAYSGEGMILHETDGGLTFYHGEGGDNCCAEDGSYVRFASGRSLPTGVWSHVVLTRDMTAASSALRFYVNGVLVGSRVTGIRPSESAQPWLVGNGSVRWTSGFVGGIDEVAVYDRALTASEVANHYGSIDDPLAYGEAVMADSPVGYWRLDEPAGPLARDETGSWPGAYKGDLLFGQPGAPEQ